MKVKDSIIIASLSLGTICALFVTGYLVYSIVFLQKVPSAKVLAGPVVLFLAAGSLMTAIKYVRSYK